MSFTFRPAVREQTSLLVALAGSSGCGKTFSALRLASGLVGPNGKIAVIDSEAGRALHYADRFRFDHGDIRPPFRPTAYLDAILAAEKAGYDAVVIDSMSHEFDGEGGICDWADDLADKGVKSPGNWKEPKLAHKRMVNRLLQMRCHLIFCLRADEKIRIEREGGKTVVVPLGWMPICEKRFMYEMTASFTLTADRPGEPQYGLPHKVQDQHRAFFPEGQKIGEAAGRALGEWAHGGAPKRDDGQTGRPANEQGDDAEAKALADQVLDSIEKADSPRALEVVMSSPRVVRKLDWLAENAIGQHGAVIARAAHRKTELIAAAA